MNKKRRNLSFPSLDNYGAQDPSDLAMAKTRNENEEIKKSIVKTMKKYKPLMALEKAGIIKEVAYETQTQRAFGRREVNQYITFTEGKARYPQLILEIHWSGHEQIVFKDRDSPSVSAAEYEPEEIKLVCDLMKYTVTGNKRKLENTIDALMLLGKM